MGKFDWRNIDRRLIYLVVILAISIPLVFRYSVRPAEMKSATQLFDVVEKIPTRGDEPSFAMVALDFGPSTKAENEPQAEVIIEHLMRRRVPFFVISSYPLAEAFLRDIPERVAARLMREFPGERWEYGREWINLGYRPGGALFLQALSKSEDLAEYLAKDYVGTPIRDIPVFGKIKNLKDIKFLGEFTGLVGGLDSYIQFFQRADYVPAIGHGCTSITIPEAYIYLDSGQLKGALEGIAGAAWYSELLLRQNPRREVDAALTINTALGVAHLAIILLIMLGNITMLLGKRKEVA